MAGSGGKQVVGAATLQRLQAGRNHTLESTSDTLYATYIFNEVVPCLRSPFIWTKPRQAYGRSGWRWPAAFQTAG